MFSIGKTRTIRLPHAEESVLIMRLDTIGLPERDRRTDGRTDSRQIEQNTAAFS